MNKLSKILTKKIDDTPIGRVANDVDGEVRIKKDAFSRLMDRVMGKYGRAMSVISSRVL